MECRPGCVYSGGREVLRDGDARVSMWDASSICRLPPADGAIWAQHINAIGLRSQKAQGLAVQITTAEKLRAGPTRVYIHATPTAINGFIKVGVKKMFIRNEVGHVHEIEPLCVLDFYVHESCQRQGYGKTLFTCMLQEEGAHAHRLGYDKPSPKLLQFLGKHFGLKSFVPQTNNFVVYRKYFESAPPSRESGGGGLASISQRPLTSKGRKLGTPPYSPMSPAGGAHAQASIERILGSPGAKPLVVVHSPAKNQKAAAAAAAASSSRYLDDDNFDARGGGGGAPARRGGRGDSHRPVATIVLGDASQGPSHFQTSYANSFGPLGDVGGTRGSEINDRIRRAQAAQQMGPARSTRPW